MGLLAAALAEMSTPEGPVPGSLLDGRLSDPDPVRAGERMTTFIGSICGCSLDEADTIAARLDEVLQMAADVAELSD